MDINTHLDNIKIFDLKKPIWYNEFLKIKMNENDILRDIYPEDVSLNKKKQPLFLETYYLIKNIDTENSIDNILLWDNYNKLYISPINLKSDKNVVICCSQWNLKTDYIYELNKLLTNIPGFILVTTHGDSTPLETYSRSKLGGQKKNNDKNNSIIDKNIFEKTKMKHWFGHNHMADHPKISSIPIGVSGRNNHYSSIYHFRDKYIDSIEKNTYY